MPHTTHKPSPRKREVPGEDGWTRIISPQRKYKTRQPSAKVANTSATPYDPIQIGRTTNGTEKTEVYGGQFLTVELVTARFEKNEKIWLQSESWSVLKEALQTYLKDNQVIKRCIIFGSGSFCGLRGNWIERWDVGFIQLAAFKAVVDTIEQSQSLRPLCYAQEPCYNDLDIEFLKTLGITTVADPKGFDLVKHSTFAYTPNCEPPVELATMFRDPAMLLTHVMDYLWRDENGVARSHRIGTYIQYEGEEARPVTLEQYEKETGEVDEELRDSMEKECQVFEAFQKAYDGIKLPNLNVANFPFNDQYLYCRADQDVDEAESDSGELLADEMHKVTCENTVEDASVQAYTDGSQFNDSTTIDKPTTIDERTTIDKPNMLKH